LLKTSDENNNDMKTIQFDIMGVGMFMIILMVSCSKAPKVVVANTVKPATEEESTGIFGQDNYEPIIPDGNRLAEDGIHMVTVLESLPTVRYVYLRVREADDEYWIATGKTEVKPGGQYFFRDGLLKVNFESKEHNRIFDRIYLVSALVESDHGNRAGILNVPVTKPEKAGATQTNGLVSIAALVANPSQYSGKLIWLNGQCVKVNTNIMGRNWVHLKDGSRDDFDLVITTYDQISVGQSVIMTGRVTTNKDFGSGYHYDILLEDGAVVQ
jgi:hypothetical protein